MDDDDYHPEGIIALSVVVLAIYGLIAIVIWLAVA